MVVYITDPIPMHGIFWAQWRYLSWHWPSLPCLMVCCHPSNKSALNRKYVCLSIWLFIYVDWHPGKHPWLDRTFIRSIYIYILFSIYIIMCIYIYIYTTRSHHHHPGHKIRYEPPESPQLLPPTPDPPTLGAGHAVRMPVAGTAQLPQLPEPGKSHRAAGRIWWRLVKTWWIGRFRRLRW